MVDNSVSVLSLFAEVLKAAKSVNLRLSTVMTLLALRLMSAVSEIVGFSIFGPLLEFIENGKAIPEKSSFRVFWIYLSGCFDFFGVSMSLASLLVAVLLVLFIRQIIGFFHGYMQGVVKAQAIKSVVDRSVGLALGAKIDYFSLSSRGKFLNDTTREAERCVTGVLKSVSLLSHMFLFLAYVGLLYVVVGYEVFYVLVCSALLAACFRPVMMKSRRMSQQVTENNRKSFDGILHLLEAIRFVKLTNNELSEFEKVKSATNQVFLGEKQLAKFSAALSFGLEPIVMTAATFFIFYSVEKLNTPVSELAAVSLYALRLLPIMKEILPGIQAVFGVHSSTNAVNQVMDGLVEYQEDGLSGKVLDLRQLNIVMDQVSYKFPNANKFLFENFNCSFDAGMVYCVTGRSGVGKSTLLELLPKLREPTKGHILIAGQNIKDVSLNSLRDIITFCSCDPKFLGLSIRKFLQSDNPQSNQELEQEIVNGLGLKELIERLPAGYDTVISDQATDFSSGQKQRIELSRALMSSKPIVIFDEPTTNLDKTNINKFIKLMTMNRFRSRKIIIIISHDEEMSGIADHVLHLN